MTFREWREDLESRVQLRLMKEPESQEPADMRFKLNGEDRLWLEKLDRAFANA